MIYIVHGDDLSKSRVLIVNQQKKSNVETKTEVGINDISPTKLVELATSGDLFGNTPFIVLDITNAGKLDLNPYVEKLVGLPAQAGLPQKATLIILSAKPLSNTNPFIKNVSKLKAKIIENERKPEGNIFRFIDYLFLKKRKLAYKEAANLSKEGLDPFYIFSMLLYEARNVASVIFDSPKLYKLSPFAKSKAVSHSKSFSEAKIKRLFNDFLTIDKQTKVGEITPDLMLMLAMEKVLNS